MLTVQDTITKVEEGSIITPAGFHAAGMHTGVKRKRNDLGMIYCEKPANAAAVYTLNVIQAAPIKVTMERIAEAGKIEEIIVDSGNVNTRSITQDEKFD